ncbi:hypothetical protein [Caballeronia sordidicola]|uniref:hypothetical protein n=1 Tax=Caballeronia sordidicola TaxID=196367 RepID=UPI001269E58D|nr:hypothetical protein [Caballeronia sordidicola]
MLTLKRAIAGAKFGATRDSRVAYEIPAIVQAATEQGSVLPSSKRIAAAMRDLGFEEMGGTKFSRYACPLSVLLPIIAEATEGLSK